MESFTKNHLLKDKRVLDLTPAESQTVSKWFHNAWSGNDCFILIMLSKLSRNSEGRGVGVVYTLSFAMMLANHNSGHYWEALKDPAP